MIRRDLETYRYPIVYLIFFVVIVFIVTSVSAETETASYWVSASNSFGSMGKWNETLDAAEKAIAIDPNNKFAWCNKAWALTHLRRYNDALAAAEKATVIDPNYYLAWTNMADALGNLKRY